MNVLFVNQTQNQINERVFKEAIDLFVDFLQAQKIKLSKPFTLELSLVFMDEAPAASLNDQFRSSPQATDILSFEPVDPLSFGELVICPDVVKKQAKEHKLTFEQECVYLIYHGILHLLGYDHEEQNIAAKEMFNLQDRGFELFLHRA